MGWIELHPYDPAWRDHFEQERDRIQETASGGLLDIFHIGSTSIPDFVAKPNIDILAVYSTKSAVHSAKDALLNGYHIQRDEDDRVVLIWNKDKEDYAFTLHLRPRDAQGWRDQLVFRELLRNDSRARAKYEGAKRTAVSEHPDDGEAYTAAKQPIIRSLTDQAYGEGYDERLPNFATEE